MDKEILNTALLAALFLALFGIAEILYHYMKVKAELTRKLVHLGTGALTLLFPLMLGSHWPVLFLCAGFAVILILSLKYDLLKSINAIDRESVGSIAYPAAVYGCYLAYAAFHHTLVFFYLPVLILAVCDPAAALCGKTWPLGKFTVRKSQKTFSGTMAFFACAFIVSMLLLSFSDYEAGYSKITIALTVASFSAGVEALSGRGFDNITIPASVIFVLKFFWI